MKVSKSKFPTPKLIPLDMSLSREQHPDLSSKDIYLVLYDGNYFTGQFSKEWFGWSFDGWYSPLQFDAPGFNSSRWQQIWKIEGKKPRNVQIKVPCPKCKRALKSLSSCIGDPEGIRHDTYCKKCDTYYRCSKSSRFPLSKAEVAEITQEA